MAKKGQKSPFFGEMETSKVFPKYHQKSTQKKYPKIGVISGTQKHNIYFSYLKNLQKMPKNGKKRAKITIFWRDGNIQSFS